MLRADRSYVPRREAEEREAARCASCPQAADAHRQMAERYAALIGEPPDRPEAEERAASSSCRQRAAQAAGDCPP